MFSNYISADYNPTTVNYHTSGCNLLLNAKDLNTIGFHDAGNRVDFILTGQRLIKLGYD